MGFFKYRSYFVRILSSLIKGLGAWRNGVASLPPLGRLPAVRILFGSHGKGSVVKINTHAQSFNKKINLAATQLVSQHRGLEMVIFDIFQPLYDLIKDLASHGFVEASRGCCGIGKVERMVFFCNTKLIGTCPNATHFVF